MNNQKKLNLNELDAVLDNLKSQTEKLIVHDEDKVDFTLNENNRAFDKKFKIKETSGSNNFSILPELPPEKLSGLFDVSSIVNISDKELEHNAMASVDDNSYSLSEDSPITKDSPTSKDKTQKIKEFFSIPKKIKAFPEKKEESFYESIKTNVGEGFEKKEESDEQKEQIIADVETKKTRKTKEDKEIYHRELEGDYKKQHEKSILHFEIKDYNKFNKNLKNTVKTKEMFLDYAKFKEARNALEGFNRIMSHSRILKQNPMLEKGFEKEKTQKMFEDCSEKTEEIKNNLAKISTKLLAKIN
jgi:hypothetical protein